MFSHPLDLFVYDPDGHPHTENWLIDGLLTIPLASPPTRSSRTSRAQKPHEVCELCESQNILNLNPDLVALTPPDGSFETCRRGMLAPAPGT
jgi:hypothetical protein